MPYYINNTNGNNLVTLQDGSIDQTTTSLTLVGKNFPTFGQYLNQNFVSLLENFSNTIPPDPSLKGQIWYDSDTKNLKFYREGSVSNNWQKVANTQEGPIEPLSPRLGDFWWDTSNSQLKLYDAVGKLWRVIGPQTTTDGKLRVIGSNSFEVQVGGNSVLTIDENGGVNTPYNALVTGYNYAGPDNVGTADIDKYLTWKPTVIYDISGNFDSSSGVFTVKTSGYYKVEAYVTTRGGGQIRLSWQKNSVNMNITATNNHDPASRLQLQCNGVIEAIVGDSIKLVYSSDPMATISNFDSGYSIQLIR